MLTIPAVQGRKTLVAAWVVLLFAVLFGLASVSPAKAEITRAEIGLEAPDESTDVDADNGSDEGRVLAAVAYAPLPLTSAGNQALKFDVTALEIQNGTWTYKASWVRTLDRQGSVYVSPKTNRSNLVRSVAVAAKAGELTADLAPATRYRVEFYSQPNAEGTLLLRKYFNTLDQNGNTVATADIPADRGGTKDVTQAGTGTQTPSQTTTLPTSSAAPLPGDPNLAIGKGGSKTSCQIPTSTVTKNSDGTFKKYITPEIWESCLGGKPDTVSAAGNLDWTWVTFGNGVRLPSSLFVNIFNNYPQDLAYRKIYKIIHFEPFANNAAVTSPDDPEAAINLPYFADGVHYNMTGVKQFPGDFDITYLRDMVTGRSDGATSDRPDGVGLQGLFPNLSYNARWEVLDKRPATQSSALRDVPQTVDVYVVNGDLTCAELYKPNYAVDMMWYAKCREQMQRRLAEEANGKIFGFGGKGYVLVAQNVPYKDGKAQFFIPYPKNISYPGKVTGKPYIGAGSFRVVVLDSRASALYNQMEGKVQFGYDGTYNPDPYSGSPLLSPEQKNWTRAVSSLFVQHGLEMYLNKTSDLKMETVANLQVGPMPWNVDNPGFNESLNDFSKYTNDPSKIITVEGGVDRPFWMSIYYIQHQQYYWSALSPAPQVTFEGELPPGLRLTKDSAYFGKGEGGTVGVGAIIGSPSAAGTYTYDVKTKVVQGGKIVEGLTRYIITIKATSRSEMRIEKISGSEGGQIRAGDTVRIQVLNDNGQVAANGNPTLYIAPAGSGCNRNDPRNYDRCPGDVGLHPDFVKKVAFSESLQNQPCNNALSGGSDPIVSWSCSEYQWRVGSIPGSDIASGNYVIYAATNDRKREGDNGEFFWAAAQINIAPGAATEGNYSQYVRETGAWTMGDYKLRFDCIVNGRDTDCFNHPTGFMAYAQGWNPEESAYERTGSFFANAGDRVTINYSSKPRPRDGYTPEPNVVWGNDWGSTIELYPTKSNQAVTDEVNKNCTSVLVPGGFGRQAVDYSGVMNGPEGTVSFTIPECMKGSAFIIKYSAYLGCNRTDTQPCAFTKQTLKMGVEIGGTGVPGGGDDVLPGTCRLPTNFDRVTCIDPRITGSGAYTTGSYRLKWDLSNLNSQTGAVNQLGTATQHVPDPGTGYYLYAKVSPARADVEGSSLLCEGNNSCSYSKNLGLLNFGQPVNRETQDRVSTPLNQTNYVKLTAACLGPSYTGAPVRESEIATCAVGGTAASPTITATGGTPEGLTSTCNINPDMFNDLSGLSSIDGTSFSADWHGAGGTYDRLVFRAGTDRGAVGQGCTPSDLTSGRCIYKTGDPGTDHPNGIPNSVNSITVRGTTPNTTYWVRVVAVCDYGKPTQRQVDAMWQVSTESACTYGVLGNCPR